MTQEVLVKQCRRCLEEKPQSEFCRNTKAKDGLHSWCKPCQNERRRERHAEDPELVERYRESIRRTARKRQENGKRYEYELRKNYGMSLADYQSLLKKQSGRCALCFTDTPGQWGTFHVDHCHETRKIRGLLCHACNTGLGLLKHDPDVLSRATQYLLGG